MSEADLRRQRPRSVQRLGLAHKLLHEGLEVLRLHILAPKYTPHRRSDSRSYIVTMRLCPVHLQIPLDRLHDLVDQVPQKLSSYTVAALSATAS